MIGDRISVLGLGRIGLPLAKALVASCFDVIGVDVDPECLTRARSLGIACSREPVQADVYIVCVPTPRDGQIADLRQLDQVIDGLEPFVRSSDLVLIESTCPIGTTDKIAKRLKACIAYCPERIVPGNIDYELIYNDRVVGGVDEVSTRLAVEFYQQFIKGGVVSTNARTAEAVKLAENAYRDLNIAYANQLSMMAHELDIDVDEWIGLANHHPRVNILKPGPGVGGHCVAVDPWFLVEAAPNLAELTRCARELNAQKTSWVISRILEKVERIGAKTVACLGLSYKPNVLDLRESPAVEIVESLKSHVTVIGIDPLVPTPCDWRDGIKQSDIVVGLVAHDAFKAITPDHLSGKVALDFGGVF